MKNILFVDDDTRLLAGLRRMLWPARDQWSMTFCSSPADAVEELERQPYDVIISDMRMPGMDGAALLKRAQELRPETVRMILSGQTSHEAILRSIGPAHYFLTKPCNSSALQTAISRACRLRDRLSNESIKRLVTAIERLPSRPKLYEKILETLNSADCSAAEVGRIVSKDLAMSARVLQIVNSSFFGLPNRVSDPQQAVSLLGIDLIKVLVLSAGIFTCDGIPKIKGLCMESVVNHSMAVGTYAQAIARAETSDPHIIDDSLLAGMMHDIGKVLLAMSVPNEYAEVINRTIQRKTSLSGEERGTFGATHAEVGGYLLDLWGIAHPVVEAVAFHHDPSCSSEEGFTPLVAVHVANALEGGHYGDSLHDDSRLLDMEFLEARGLVHRLPEWKRMVASFTSRGGK